VLSNTNWVSTFVMRQSEALEASLSLFFCLVSLELTLELTCFPFYVDLKHQILRDWSSLICHERERERE
jgi:hypothetical protein